MSRTNPHRATVTADAGLVRVSRRIAALPEDIFDVLADPRRHLDLDGSGMLRGAGTDAVVSGVGDMFIMRMYFAGLGDYEMNNHVVAYDLNRRIGWEPEAGRGHPDNGTAAGRWGHSWTYELAPDGPEATIVTEIYDCSRQAAETRVSIDDGRIWIEDMVSTLERLDELVGRPGVDIPR